jgi:hypothetical protein
MKANAKNSNSSRLLLDRQHFAAFLCLALSLPACGGSGGSAHPAMEPGDNEGGAPSTGTAGTSSSAGKGGKGMDPSGGMTQTGGGGMAQQGGTSSGGTNTLPSFGGASHEPAAPCPTDASKVGVWENVEPDAFHMPANMQTIAVAVNPKQGSVYASASNRTNGGDGCTGIYKSMDCGSTWKLQSTGASSEKLKTGQLWAMLIDPVEPDNVYAANGYGDGPTLYKSPNGGVDWVALKPDAEDVLPGHNNFVQCVAMEQKNPKHIAVTFHDNCGKNYNQLCFSRSVDGGANWQLFNGPNIGGWQEAATFSVLGPTHYFYLSGAGAWFTPDTGKTWTKVIEKGFFARYAGSVTIAPDGTAYAAGALEHLFFSKETDGSPLGAVWKVVENSPQSTNVIHDGVNLIAAQVNGPPFFTAKLSDPTVWTHMDTPSVTAGSSEMAFDPVHNVLYSANFENGLLRMVTK